MKMCNSRCQISGLTLPLLLTCGLLFLQVQPTWAQRGPSVVELVEAEHRVTQATQWTLGTVIPSRRAVIGSAVDGRVTEFLVREGERVEKDQALASLLVETIRLEIESAEAELELRNEEYEELVNGARPEELTQAKARMEAAKVLTDFAQSNYRRFSELGSANAVSRSEAENALSAYQGATQRYLEAKAAYELMVAGTRAEQIKQAEARVKMQQATVERLKDQLGKHTMRSKFAGYVTVEHTEVGQWLPRGEPVAEIVALDDVFVLAKVLELHIPFVRVGSTVEVEVPALTNVVPPFTGTVEAIIPEADERSRTFPVKIRVKNIVDDNGPQLKAGMLARAEIPIENPREPLMVPKDTLVLNDELTSVWIVDPASMVENKAAGMMEANVFSVLVETGTEDDDWIEVIASNEADTRLTSGALVVVLGNERIPPSPPGAPPSRVTWRVTK